MIDEGGTSNHNDTVDIIFQSTQKTVEYYDENGKLKKQQILDELSLWCKTLSVSSNKLGQFIFEMMEWTREGLDASYHMSGERAKQHVRVVMGVVESWRKALDAKSGESIRNDNNSQSTLIDKINKNSVEKIYSIKGEAKKSLWSSIIGKEKEKMSDDD